MFTGIIKKISRVEKTEHKNGGIFVWLKKPAGWKIRLGESIAINGICSTVKKISGKNFLVEYMPETINKTTAGEWQKGTLTNLEKSLKLNDLLDGHLVTGHIDAVGEIIDKKTVGDSVVLKIKMPIKLMKFIAPKGSMAMDGISLTTVDAGRDWFTVSLVGYTLENTNLGLIKIGDKVNIETDIIAKYLASRCRYCPAFGSKSSLRHYETRIKKTI